MSHSPIINPFFKKAFLAFLLSTHFFHCAPLPPPLEGKAFEQEKAALDSTIFEVRNLIRKGKADALTAYLAPDARSWIKEMIWASKGEAREELSQRPFHEVLFIVALKVEQIRNPAKYIDEKEALKLMFYHGGPAYNAVIRSDFGPPTIRGYRAEIGLAKAPHVPVFYFDKENEKWTFDLVKSLPLIVRELESVARTRRDNVVDQVLWVLKTAGQWADIPNLDI